MSKKLKNKGIIPAAMSGKRFSALSDLGSALGFKPSEPPTPKSMKCWKCGTAMRNIPGTNVWVCDAVIEQDKDGIKKQGVCGNRAMTTVRTAYQNYENSGDFKSKQKGDANIPGKSAPAATA